MLIRGKRGLDDRGSARLRHNGRCIGGQRLQAAMGTAAEGEVIGPDGRRALRLSAGAQIRAAGLC